MDGIKVCTLLALFNIFDKATLAIIHVGMSSDPANLESQH